MSKLAVVIYRRPQPYFRGVNNFRSVERVFWGFARKWQHFFDAWEVWDIDFGPKLKFKNQTVIKASHYDEETAAANVGTTGYYKTVIFSPFSFIYDPEVVRSTFMESKSSIVLIHPNPFIRDEEAHIAMTDPELGQTISNPPNPGFHTVGTQWLGYRLISSFTHNRIVYEGIKEAYDRSTIAKAVMWQNIIDKKAGAPSWDYTGLLEDNEIATTEWMKYEREFLKCHPFMAITPTATKS